MESKDAFDHVGGDPAGSFADACDRGVDDALLGGQQLGGRVTPVAARDRDDVAAPGPQVLGAGVGVGEDPDDPLPLEESGRQCGRLVGGDVECPGHRTHGVAAGERRSEQGDGQCPDAGGAGVQEMLFVDLPVVERHAVLAGQDPKDLLDLCGTGRRERLTLEGSGHVVDAGGSQVAGAVGEIDPGQLLHPSLA